MLSFDEWLTNYTVAGFLLVLAFSLLFIQNKFSNRSPPGRIGWLWAAGFFIVLLMMRYPFIAFNQELDVDESQMLAQALSLKNYWIYWKYVDGLTQGPLASYFLILPSWFGLPFDYTSARMLGFVFLSITLTATCCTFRNLFSWPAALLAFLPIAFFYLLSQGAFTTLYNEYVCLCLLSICFWLFSILYKQEQPASRTLFLLGFIAGMVPFAKLQGVPTAMLIVIFAGLLVLLRSIQKAKPLASLIFGGLLFPVIVTLLAVRFEAIEFLWNFYVLGNFQYSSGGSIWEKALNYLNFLRKSGQFAYLIAGYGLLIGYAFVMAVRARKLLASTNLLFWFGLLHIVIAFYAVIKSGYLFPHYQQFVIIPIGIFTGVLLDMTFTENQWTAQKMRLIFMAGAAILMLPHFAGKAASVYAYSSKNRPHISRADLGKPLAVSPVSKEIMRYIVQGDAITVWGWHPSYHLETGLSQATGDVIAYRILTENSHQPFYLAKYLEDLKQRKPAVLVDQVTTQSFWFNDTARYTHEHFPGVNDFVLKNYQLVSTIQDERIYVRNDRVKTFAMQH
ncbi:hypothetical protein [Dyadobacter sp. CY326]|uniref:hypothetical protein n=1 Tax=Dyadobacter sp. CY326 TaxID=2907300 RepID=UPI001F48CE6F|nr:hypothetical protein [Dyadobacter sp. CY326]MCE7066945.1 hypothetical protein [Dyadobacter sp. CY326]